MFKKFRFITVEKKSITAISEIYFKTLCKEKLYKRLIKHL